MFERPDHVAKSRIDHHEPVQLLAPLYVVTAVFNPIRYRSRWKLYEDFVQMVERSGAILYTAEIAFGHRQFAITEPDNPRHLQVTTTSEIWHKERALNLVIQRLPIDWQYVATIDADISFVRGDWANETVHQLQHYDIVQMWGEAEDLDARHHTLQHDTSFVADWIKYRNVPPEPGYYGKPGPMKVQFHPGYAWAYRRQALEDLGGLIDWGITGAGDNHMAKSLVGNARQSVHIDIKGAYLDWIMQWQDRAVRYIKKNIGFVDGKILHYWHGPKQGRKYWDRWKILTNTQFSPYTDLKRDTHGLYQLVTENSRQQRLRDLLREYFRGRDEDATS